MSKAGLVLTTINDPVCLEGYYENFKKYGHLEDVTVYLIGDVKTPPEAAQRCVALGQKGLTCIPVHYTFGADFLTRIGLRPEFVPLNSDNRRNIGYLMAVDNGADFVISIDDDNYCVGDNYFKAHRACLGPTDVALSNTEGWLNPCDWLDTRGEPVFQRGFPYYARKKENTFSQSQGQFEVHVNEGLWFGEPDLDAITWLVNPARSYAHKRSFTVGKDTWAPLNSQNTAVRAEAIPAYYFIPMDGTIRGQKIDHDGDIFQGYFFQKCMKHMGGHLRVGTPIVEHRRNHHNYFDDVEKEWQCIRLLEEMLPWLTEECKLTGSDYCEAYECLAEQLVEWQAKNAEIGRIAGGWLQRVAERMKLWAGACRRIGVKRGVAKSA